MADDAITRGDIRSRSVWYLPSISISVDSVQLLTSALDTDEPVKVEEPQLMAYFDLFDLINT